MSATDWATKPLGELFAVGAGKTMSAAARAGENKVPFLRTSNVLWDEIDVAVVDQMAIPERELIEKSLKVGDLLVCEGGEIGRAAVWEGGQEPMSFQNHLHRLRPKVDDVDPRFYVYFLQAAFTQLGIFGGAGNKTTIPNLSSGRLKALDVPHPPLPEQVAIADALRHVQRARRLNARLIATTEQLKTAAMRQLFSRGLRGESQKETEVGPIPGSWELVELGEVREFLQYGTSVHCTLDPKEYPVLRIPNIEPGRVNDSELKYCDLPEAQAKKYLLENGDLLFIRTNGVIDRLGSCAVYAGAPESALFASYLIRARLKARALPKFVAYFYGSTLGTSLVAGRATPASDGKYNLNTGTIDALPLPLPSTLEEQQEIVDVLDALDRKIDLHRRKREVLDQLFKSLLHKVMTGEVSVDDLDLSALPTFEGSAA
ncbi:restriction endonuclease subunit S [Nocardioides panacisoli]|uniref:restriction endonuclease subunit S n=1 Tax=Nocardioides panacisoli TaxID=627624 RepID=UPI001C62C220|nr:restriction endonuclease subunit S [Nocardioides panacisoli]QYJ04179.1 restriction endonuclease subunit S [Nocardioides panacisoli]